MAILYSVETKVLKQKLRDMYFLCYVYLDFETNCSKKHQSIPRWFHVWIIKNGRRIFKITICDLKGKRTALKISIIRFHKIVKLRGHVLVTCPLILRGISMMAPVAYAIKINISIMRAFVEMRKLLSTHEELKQKIETMESKYDEQFRIVFDAIRQLLIEEEIPNQKIGF